MKAAIELHDSELLEIDCGSGDEGVVILDAYVHRSDGHPGTNPGQGGFQKVRIRMRSMVVSREPGQLPQTIFDGSLMITNVVREGLIESPLRTVGGGSLTLEMLDDVRAIQIRGIDLAIDAMGGFRFVEDVDFTK